MKIDPIKGFSLKKTLEFGHCFRVSKTSNETYILGAYNRVIEVGQMGNYLYIENTSIEDVENIWIHYFDLERNYDTVYSEIRDNKQMEDVVDDFIELKFGYRAKYFEKIYENLITHSGSYDRHYFLSLKGIGNKIADCVLLYGGIDISTFLIDIWITRVLEAKFGYSSSNYLELSTLGREMFGYNVGIAEILLFYYAQTQKIGKVKK